MFVNNFRIGCDPEFLVVGKNGKGVNLTHFFHVGAGPLGFDHGGRVAELRPEPRKGTFALIKQMQRILQDSDKAQTVKTFKWRSGAYYKDPQELPGEATMDHYLGGHVHFDIPSTHFTQAMITALNSVAKYLDEIEVMPKAENQVRRHLWGKFGEVRTDWPDNHVEYRSFSSWLTHPMVAFLVLTMAKLAVISPENATPLADATSTKALNHFLSKFQFKDQNAARLCEMLESNPKWLHTPPDSDIRKAWGVI